MADAFPAQEGPAHGVDDDAALLDLGRRWEELRDQRTWHYDVILEPAEMRFYSLRPEFPKSLIKTESDAEMRLCVPENVGRPFDPVVFETWRGKQMKRSVAYPVTPELREKHGLPEDATVIHLLEPWPEKQARADQILNDWDAYQAARRQAEIESGIEDAEKRDSEFCAALDPIEREILLTPARTIEGFLVKVRLAATYAFVKPDRVTPDFDKELQAAIEHNEVLEQCGISLLRDLFLLSGSTIKARAVPSATQDEVTA